MSHVAHLNESCRTHESSVPHTWMSIVAYINESCRKYEWVMSHTKMSPVAHINESCRTHEWVMSHTKNECCRTYECVKSYSWKRGTWASFWKVNALSHGMGPVPTRISPFAIHDWIWISHVGTWASCGKMMHCKWASFEEWMYQVVEWVMSQCE